jgi:hypothetical protein
MLRREDWRRQHNEELHNLYASPNIIRVAKLRRKIWPVHVAHMGDTRNAYKILVGKPVLMCNPGVDYSNGPSRNSV